MGWAGETQCIPLVCTACKLSKSILKPKKCKIHVPIYRSWCGKVNPLVGNPEAATGFHVSLDK